MFLHKADNENEKLLRDGIIYFNQDKNNQQISKYQQNNTQIDQNQIISKQDENKSKLKNEINQSTILDKKR